MTDTAPALTPVGLAAATPPDRDRYADLVRLASIGMVVLGHWVVGLLTVHGAAGVGTSMPLMLSTWLWQVMALFFFVGGFAHARALRHAPPTGRFLRARAARLLPPVVVMLAAWTAVTAAAAATGLTTGVFALGLHTITVPLWFIGVYLLVVLAAPTMMRLHRRAGLWPVVGALAAATASVDLLARGLGWTPASYANLLFVWLAVHQLGYGYADGTLTRRTGAALAAGGLLGTVALVFGTGAYPVLMVGLPGNEVSNSSPPTLALLTQSLMLVGLALLLRRAGTVLAARPRTWVVVAGSNSMIMTIFCWHLSALYLVQGALLVAGVRLPAADSAAWWLGLPVWLVGCALACAALVVAFRRFEAVRLAVAPRPAVAPRLAVAPRPAEAVRPAVAPRPAAGAIAGGVLAAVGLFAVSRVGLDGLVDGHPGPAALSLVAVAAGYPLVRGRVGRA